MAEWTVSPSEGVINNHDGTFTFPSNSSYCNKDYVVTYTDSGCTCSVNVTVKGQYCIDSYTNAGYGDGGTIYPGCAGGTYTVEADVPYNYTARTVVNCECVETGTGHTTFHETETVEISRNCGSATSWSDSKGNISYRVEQGGGCGDLAKCPVNNCTSDGCTGGRGVDIHIGSSDTDMDGSDSYETNASTVSFTYSSSGNISVIHGSSTGGSFGYGYYNIKYTGSDWASLPKGAYLGSYTVNCTAPGYASGFSVSVYKYT